jgi:hypothetical protein
MKNKYIVLNEHTLGYIIEGMPAPIGYSYMGILHGSVIKGGHDWKNGPVLIHPSDKVRQATLKDFEDYRVCSKGHI